MPNDIDMIAEYCQWKKQPVVEQDGVIVGCTRSQEWLLPWWWMHYSMHNESPVMFFDFGDMSPAAKAWCAKKGRLATLNHPKENFVVPKEKVPAAVAAVWDLHQDLDTYKVRVEWFKKPFACLQSDFKRAIWIDLDCQVRRSIAPMFEACENPLGIALAEEPLIVLQNHENSGLIQKGEMEYNTGVIVFKHDNLFIPEWAKLCMESNHILRGDQEALSRLALQKGIRLSSLFPIYNQRWHLPIDSSNVIIHWLGNGKKAIQFQIQFLVEKAVVNFSLE